MVICNSGSYEATVSHICFKDPAGDAYRTVLLFLLVRPDNLTVLANARLDRLDNCMYLYGCGT